MSEARERCEWTAESVGDLGCEDFYAAQAIADAHNAALAAEREQVKKEGIAGRLIFEQLREQLAADRETGVKALADRSFELHECQKQLAAERELTGSYAGKVAWCEVHRPIEPVTICPACECVHLSDQLAAEREKVRQLTETLFAAVSEKAELKKVLNRLYQNTK